MRSILSSICSIIVATAIAGCSGSSSSPSSHSAPKGTKDHPAQELPKETQIDADGKEVLPPPRVKG
jgi:hypothetical protein